MAELPKEIRLHMADVTSRLHGLEIHLSWMWGVAVVAIFGFGGTIWWLFDSNIGRQVDQKLQAALADRPTKDDLHKATDELARQLADINLRLALLSVRAASSQAEQTAAVTALVGVVDGARRLGQQLDQGTVRSAGNVLADLAAKPGPIPERAIAATLDVGSYFSTVTASPVPSSGGQPPAKGTLLIDVDVQPSSPNAIAFGPVVTIAATITRLDNTSASSKPGPRLLLLDGDPEGKGITRSIRLDDHLFRNVVLKNMNVVWERGPIVLENVIFIGCRFIVARPDDAVRLSRQLLAGGSVNFKADG